MPGTSIFLQKKHKIDTSQKNDMTYDLTRFSLQPICFLFSKKNVVHPIANRQEFSEVFQPTPKPRGRHALGFSTCLQMPFFSSTPGPKAEASTISSNGCAAMTSPLLATREIVQWLEASLGPGRAVSMTCHSQRSLLAPLHLSLGVQRHHPN